MYVPLSASPHLLSLHRTPLGAILFTPTLPIVASCILVALFLLGIVLRGGAFLHRRRAAISALAARHNLHPSPDDALPRGLSLEGTHFHQPHKLTNIHHGVINHREVIIFDIEKEETQGSWSRTILAIRTRDRISAPSSLESHQAGQWRLIYSAVGLSNSINLMEVDQLESLLRNIIR